MATAPAPSACCARSAKGSSRSCARSSWMSIDCLAKAKRHHAPRKLVVNPRVTNMGTVAMDTATDHLESIAHLCATLQQPYGRIAKAVEALGLTQKATLNGIAYLDREAGERIADHQNKKASATAPRR